MKKYFEIINSITEQVMTLKNKASARKRIGLSWDPDGYPIVKLNGHGDSSLCRKLKAWGIDGDVIRTISHPFGKLDRNVLVKRCDDAFEDNENLSDKDKAFLDDVRRNIQLRTLATSNWMDHDGTVFVAFGKSASQERCAESTWLNSKIADAAKEWWTMGLPLENELPATKFYTYMMMSDSTSTPVKDVFADIYDLIAVDFDKVGVFKDIQLTNYGFEFDHVINDKVTRMQKPDTQKWSDGMMIGVLHTKRYDLEQTLRFTKAAEEGKFAPYSSRGIPFVKGLKVYVTDVALEKYIRDKNLNRFVKDYWGNEVDILNLDIIMFDSTFKAAKAKCITSWQMYADLLKKYNHEPAVCKLPHFRKADLPYQQMQALMLDTDGVNAVVKYHTDRFEKTFTPAGAVSRLHANERAVAQLFPNFLGDVHFMDQIQSAHTRDYAHCANGRILDIGHYVFLMPDPAAILESLLGKTRKQKLNPEGLLKDRQLHCELRNPKTNKMVFEYGHDVGYTRNPCPGMNIMRAKNINVPAEYAGLYMSNVCYVSVHGLTMPVLQADFDGDTVLMWNAEKGIGQLVSTYAAKAQKDADYRCVSFESNVPTMKAGADYLKTSILNSKPAEIGLFAMAIAKIVSRYGFWDPRLRVLEAWMTLCVDAAKNGGVTPPEVAAILEGVRLWKTPSYIGYGKIPMSEVGRSELPEKYQKILTSAVERCSDAVLNSISPDYDFSNLNVKFDDSSSMSADWRVLCSDAGIAAGKLSGLYRKPAGNGCVCDDRKDFCNSLFGKLVHEYREDAKDATTVEARSLVDKTNYEKIKTEVLDFGASRGCNADVTLNTLIMFVYRWESNLSIRKELLRALWLCFGKEMAENALWNRVNDTIPVNCAAFSEDEIRAVEELVDDNDCETIAFYADEEDEGCFIMD